MATWADVRRLALALPEATERGTRDGPQWRVRDRTFVWERPLRPADLTALGADAPPGPVLGVHVADIGVKDALIASDPGSCFTTPHFDGYPAVLVRLDVVDGPQLAELVVEAWLARAPKRLAAGFLDRSP